MAAEIAAEEAALGDRGRVLVRPAAPSRWCGSWSRRRVAGHGRGRRRPPGRGRSRPLRRLTAAPAEPRLLGRSGPRLVRVRDHPGRRATALVGPVPRERPQPHVRDHRRRPSPQRPRRPPSPAEVTDRLEAAARLLRRGLDADRCPPTSATCSTDAAAEVAAVDAPPAGRRRASRPCSPTRACAADRRPTWPRARPPDRGASRRRLDADAALAGAELERVNAALIALKDAVWAVQRDRLRTAAAVADLAGPDAGPAALEAVHLRPAGALRHRPPRGPRPRLGRAAPARARPRPRPRRRRRCAPCSPPAPPTRCSARSARAHPRRPPQLRLQGGRRDRRARRQHPRRSATPIRADPLLRQALAAPTAEAVVLGHTRWASVGIISQPNAHPLNSEELDAHRRARTSPPCSTATSTTSPTSRPARRCASPPRSPPTPRSSPRSRRAAWPPATDRRRGLPQHGRRSSRARWPSPPAPPPRPTTCCSPCGAAARRSTSASPRTSSSWPASPTAWSRRPTTYLRLDGETPADPANPAEPRPGRAPARRRRRHARGHRRCAYDGTALAGRRRRARHRPDHHPRHRPRRQPRTSC